MQNWQNKIKNNEPVLMAILNISPDSFFDGGVYNSKTGIKKRIEEFQTHGVDIIDIGAESSRPGAHPVNEAQELKRLLPVLEIVKNMTEIPVSIDTYKPGVALKCLENGADIVNDIYGTRKPGMKEILAEYQVPVIIMHMNGEPSSMQENPMSGNQVDDVIDFLEKSAEENIHAGVMAENIVLDPGIGFGKEQDLNLRLISETRRLKKLGYPLLIGASRKSLIGAMLDVPKQDRMLGSVLVNMMALLNGYNIVRTHDIKETMQMIKVFNSFKYQTVNIY